MADSKLNPDKSDIGQNGHIGNRTKGTNSANGTPRTNRTRWPNPDTPDARLTGG